MLVLRSLTGPVRSQPGCTQTLLMRDVQEDARITWVSRWRSRSDLDGHLRSRHFHRLATVMELASERPDILFERSSDFRGLDLVDEVLAGSAPLTGTRTQLFNPADPENAKELSPDMASAIGQGSADSLRSRKERS